MAGSPEYTRITELQANPSKQIKTINASFVDAIAASGSHSVLIYSPVGYVSRVLHAHFLYPIISGASSGTLKIYVSVPGSIGVVYGVYPYTQQANYLYSEWIGSPSTPLPTDKSSQLMNIQNSYFDEDSSLRIDFINETDVSDGGTEKKVILLVEETKISG